jgi:Tfp pilus assembly protein PilN
MIEVNLLPAGTKRRGASKDVATRRAVSARLGKVRAVFGDAYLVGAVVTFLLSAGVTGALWYSARAEQGELQERERAAVADSARYAAVIDARKRATAERDSVERQLAVITAIDSSRYVWAHVLDEVSRVLPPYTWLTAVQQTSAPPAPPTLPVAAAAKGAPAAPDSAGAADTTRVAVRRDVAFRITGQTVDIQALTLFMRDLAASPWLDRIQLARSEAVLADGKDVTEFTLDGVYRQAPDGVARTRALVIPVAPVR